MDIEYYERLEKGEVGKFCWGGILRVDGIWGDGEWRLKVGLNEIYR